MMGITHVGLFTAGGIYGSVASPPSSYWFPPIAPSLISPTTLGLFSSDPNNHWDKPQGRWSCSLSLHFQDNSRISIVITIILILSSFCNSNPPYSSNLAIASCPSPHLLPNNPSQKYPPHLFKQLLMFLQLLLLLLGNSGKFLVLLLDSIETPCSFFLMSQCVKFFLFFRPSYAAITKYPPWPSLRQLGNHLANTWSKFDSHLVATENLNIAIIIILINYIIIMIVITKLIVITTRSSAPLEMPVHRWHWILSLLEHGDHDHHHNHNNPGRRIPTNFFNNI